jgi:eukaryotic-like serine/threonine-protein kinase
MATVEVGPGLPLHSGLYRPLNSRPGRLGRYELGDIIGEGGMGRVWAAYDPDLRREVAIKVLSPRRTHRSDAPSRFVAEAQINAQLDHPNIVPVHDMGLTSDGDFFMVMKRVRGRSFKKVLREEDLSLHRLLSMFHQVCRAVAYAHRRGVMHRDLKPSNIMVGTEGEVLVMDWGIAALQARPGFELGVDKAPARDDVVMGTPGYMAPEQASLAGPSAPTADAFSLGAILYEILTGRRAFAGKTAKARFSATLVGKPPDPQFIARGRAVPPLLSELAMRALSQDPSARPRHAGVFAEALDDHFEGSRRQTDARDHVARARRAQALAEELEAGEAALRLTLAAEQARLKPWSSLTEKARLHEISGAQRELALRRTKAFAAASAEAERALFSDPECAEAAEFLAEQAWSDLRAAEALGRRSELPRLEERLRAFGGPAWIRRLDAGGSVSLRTSATAEVTAQSVDRRGLIWTLGSSQRLGSTPLDDVPLAAGSWLLTLAADGHEDVVYPVFLEREGHWDSGDEPVFLPPLGSLPAGTVYVPGGPFRCGGDRAVIDSLPAREPWVESFVIHRLHTTRQEWARFVDAEPSAEEEAVDPRTSQWPALPSSARADAYIAWRAAEDGVAWRRPSELEWEKAARGVDGRDYPWGDRYDPVLANNRLSRSGPPTATPVGSFEHDCSVFGMKDVAGNARTRCTDHDAMRGAGTRTRGGFSGASDREARLDARSHSPVGAVDPVAGVRLTASWPAPAEP